MERTKFYTERISQATEIAREYIKSDALMHRLEEEQKGLLNDLSSNRFIKVPFVGDFNAGKSSLLNTMMGINLLPTDIVPTTAVAYELYYSEEEYLQIYHKGEKQGTAPLSQIGALKAVPGDVVYVYLKNDFLKRLNDRGIVLVDMPGINSGIEAHNNAILSYIQEGSYFILLSEIEQGTLSRSTLRFIDELKKYGLKCSIFLSKVEGKPESEVPTIVKNVEDIAQRIIGPDAVVGTVSSVTKQYDDVLRVLDNLDAETFITQKYSELVCGFIDEIIEDLQLQIKLACSDKKDFQSKIAALGAEREKTIESLRAKAAGAQSLENSADDVLNDIREALVKNSLHLAHFISNNNSSTDAFSAELLSIIRPVLFSSFKREISEYQNVIGDSVRDFSLKVNDILQDKGNQALDAANEIIGNLLGREVLEGLLKKGLDKLMEKLIAYKGLSTLLGTLGKILGPLVTILLNIIPDLLRLIFGKSRESKVDLIRQKIVSEIVPKIVESLREPVTTMLDEQRREAMNSMEQLINSEAQKFNDSVKMVQQEQRADEESTALKVKALQVAIDKLENLKR